MKKKLAELTELGAQLERLRGAIEDARRGRERRAPSPVRTPLRSPRAAQPESVGDARAPRSGFVEFSGAQLMGTVLGPVVELVGATGARLTIRLSPGQSFDAAAVVAAFLGEHR